MINENELSVKLADDHKKFLARYGVKMPSGKLLSMLIFLYANIGRQVSNKELTEYISSRYPETSKDNQPRHLKYAGWDVRLSGKSNDQDTDGNKIKNGHTMLVTTKEPSKDYLITHRKRDVLVSSSDFKEICEAYDNRCGYCGKDSVRLEKGHRDPSASLEGKNIIPLCSACNNWMSDDIVLDDKDRIKYITSIRLIRKAPLLYRKRIAEELDILLKKKYR